MKPIPPYAMPVGDELPPNTAGWQPDADRAVLLVHDMQRYFVQAFPPDHQPRGDLVAHTRALVAAARNTGVPVVYTAQPGGMTQQQRGLLKDFWGPGMQTTAADREIIPELSPRPGEPVLTKWRYSAFARSDLLAHLRGQGRDQLMLCGVYAYIGVLATALEAFAHDIETFLIADAVADLTAENHRLALRYAASRCAVVVPTADALDALGRTSSVANA